MKFLEIVFLIGCIVLCLHHCPWLTPFFIGALCMCIYRIPMIEKAIKSHLHTWKILFTSSICGATGEHKWIKVGALERVCNRCGRIERRTPKRAQNMEVYDFTEWKLHRYKEINEM